MQNFLLLCVSIKRFSFFNLLLYFGVIYICEEDTSPLIISFDSSLFFSTSLILSSLHLIIFEFGVLFDALYDNYVNAFSNVFLCNDFSNLINLLYLVK